MHKHCHSYCLDSNTIKETQIFKTMFWALLITAYITGDCDRLLPSLMLLISDITDKWI